MRQKSEKWKLEFASRNLKVGIEKLKLECWNLPKEMRKQKPKKRAVERNWLRAKLDFFEIYLSNFRKYKNRKPTLKSWRLPKEMWKLKNILLKPVWKEYFSSKTTERTTAVCSHLGFWAEFKVGFVFGSSVFNRYFWFTNPKRTASGGTLYKILNRITTKHSVVFQMI